MRITILGCGSSGGVPLVGCQCTTCLSENPKNKRQRVSILVEEKGARLLVDTSPDLRQQCLQHGITSIDAVIYTHEHSDHSHGIDETRNFNYHRNGPLDIYGDAETLAALQTRFGYAFKPPIPEYGWFRPCLKPHTVTPYVPLAINGVEIMPFEQGHGGGQKTLGLRFGKFAYSTDVKDLSEAAFKALEGVEVWVVDCLKYTPAPTHAHLELTLQWVKRVNPRLAVLTHMSHELDYEKLVAELPDGIIPGYDGTTLEIQ